MRELLSDPCVDPGAFGKFALREAAKNDWLDVVKLLLADARLNPADWDNGPIILASLLGAASCVDPYAGRNSALSNAEDACMAGGGRSALVRLLPDRRVVLYAAKERWTYRSSTLRSRIRFQKARTPPDLRARRRLAQSITQRVTNDAQPDLLRCLM